MTACIEVVFNLPVNRGFLYLYPDTETDPTGRRVKAPLGRRTLTGCVVNCFPDNPEPDLELKPIDKFIDKEPIIGRELIELAEWMSRLYLCSLGEALSSCLPGGIRETAAEMPDFFPEDPSGPVIPSVFQREAVKTILSGDDGWFYLYGVTGSGKTEVFLTCAEQVLKEGKSVIYLVPEIALTHQVLNTIQQRFGSRAAVIHSSLTPSRKLAEWQRIRRGEATIIIGARSAVFAPVASLG
ncbi:MAG: DEAD/DEAH box helicase, partial [Spirochaetales bacterium]